MSLFRKPEESGNICTMLRGEAGSGKTRFALASSKTVGKKVAYIGNDRGAKFYRAEFDFEQVETSDIKTVREAVAELGAAEGIFRTPYPDDARRAVIASRSECCRCS